MIEISFEKDLIFEKRREKNNKIAQDLKFLDLMLLVFENFGGKTPRNTKLKNFKIKTQGKLKNTLKTHKKTRT